LKGFDYLKKAIDLLASKISIAEAKRIIFIDFGGEISSGKLSVFKNISLGHINCPSKLALIYSSADCVIVPSLVESFGQIAAESLSCSTPVICFNTSGLRDIVIHEKTGLVASCFEIESLAQQLYTMIELPIKERKSLGLNGRIHIVSKFSFDVIYPKYTKLLNEIIIN
jgi:glycosyltransferase involved in cell wall biosynthesis